LKLAGADMYSFCLSFYDTMKKDTGIIGKQFRSFIKEIRQEIWSSKEELEQYYKKEENYNKLVSGIKGENLLGKYKAISICEGFDLRCDFFCTHALQSVNKGNPNERIEFELDDIRKHVIAKGNNVISKKNMRGDPVKIILRHDIFKWQKDKYEIPLANYKLPNPKEAVYIIREEGKEIVKEILSSYSHSKSALWKVVAARYYLPILSREGTFI